MRYITNPRQRRAVVDTATKLLEEVAKAHNLAVKTLRGKECYPHIIKARRDYCIKGREANLQTKVLAFALNCHHTTITYHANERYRVIKNTRRMISQPQGEEYAEVP